MKTRALSLTLVTLMTLQSAAWAQSSRTEGIGDQEIARAQREMAILRHDLQRLSAALTETETALRERPSQGRMSNILSLGTAVTGLSLAVLAATTTMAGGKTRATLITVQTALSAVAGYVNYRETKDSPSEAADKAVSKARQEILAARASGSDNSEAMAELMKLDQALETLQSSLHDYKSQQTLSKRIHIAGMVSQTAGTAMSIGLAVGILRSTSSLGQILMASGNIATILQSLTPAKDGPVLDEIVKTRAAVNLALESI